ncbi:MAG: UDP-N-acetylglucosamine--N-acetylmuramyl-(pentapeptide) pyrophosphoryl-undecaprenol N-acetylglucosamine transferase [Euryarchaeota archaeon]|nr:UDP-N-acetylglucosamine--N-acetylmuramyl-(pentapeptide) pyrophosphoryl-undecaprenol N-acetylglucosamine transferase [Euryarchaeota archaeon]
MKVLLVPCGIGLGHASRCMSLARKLQEKGVEVAFASYGMGYEMLSKNKIFKTSKLPEMKFYGDDGELDIKYTVGRSMDLPFIFLKSMYYESKIVKDFKPDIVIADSHYSVPVTCKILGIPCIMVSNELTLNFSKIYPEDKKVQYIENGLERFIIEALNICNGIIVPDIKGSIEIPPKLKDNVFFTGPFLKKSPKLIPSKKELRDKFGFDHKERIVLVTVGGSEFGKKLLKLVYEASDMVECEQIIMVTGPQIQHDLIPDSSRIIKKKFLDDLMEWMKLSDVVISLAGHTTTMEIACLGIPNIIVPIKNHPEQIRNARNMEKFGISIVRGIKKISPQGFAKDINNMLHNNSLKIKIEASKKQEATKKQFSKYRGTEYAAEIIMKLAN